MENICRDLSSLETLLKWVESDFMPHGHCYLWKPELVMIHSLSDISIAIAYFTIPIIMFKFAFLKKDPKLNSFLTLYILFIFLCGLTHINEVINLWNGFYYYSGVVKLMTAIISLITAYKLFADKDYILSIPSPSEIEQEKKKLSLTNDELDKMINEKTNKLQRYASWVSHDLKEPIRNIKNFSGLLKSNSYNKLEAKEKGFLDHITGGVERLENLVDALLQFSKIENFQEESSMLSLKEELYRILKSLKNDINSCQAEIRIIVDANIKIQSHPILLHTIFTNLISNSLRFRSPNRNLIIRIESIVEADNLIIKVKDNGLGIKENLLDKIFEPYHKGSSELSQTGLGLSFVRSAMEYHQGRVSVNSEIDQFAEFVLIFPSQTTN